MFSITLNAQTDFSFGPKIGYKSNDYNFPLGVSLKNRGNLTLGAYGRFMFNNLVIQPELMYNYITICTGPVTIKKNHSFALPVYLGYQFINRDNFNIRVNVGPVVNLNFDKYADNLIPSGCDIAPGEQLFDDNMRVSYKYWDYNFANLAAAFSLGADIYRFTIDLGYNLGLTKVFYDGIVTTDKIYPNNNIIRQNTLTFSVGYRFGK